MELIYAVESVSFKIDRSERPILMIAAVGITNSSGWTLPRLQPIIYAKPPSDGIWEFQFVAQPPAGISLRVMSRVHAYYVGPVPGELVGVRILSSTKPVQETISGTWPADQASSAGGDKPHPGPGLMVGGEQPSPSGIVAGGDKPYPGPGLMVGGEQPFPGIVAGGDKPFPGALPLTLAGDMPHPAPTITLKGVLRANGDGRTGWSLAEITTDADLAEAVITDEEAARSTDSQKGRTEYLDGRSVEVRGVFELRRYVIGGYVWTLQVSSITPNE